MERSSTGPTHPVPGRAVTEKSERGRSQAGQHLHRGQDTVNVADHPENGLAENFAQESGYDTQRYCTATNAPPKLVQRQIKRRMTSPNSLDCEQQSTKQDSHGAVLNMKKKLTHNIEHYSNLFQEITFPLLFRRSGRNQCAGTGSRNRHDSGRSNNNKSESCLLSEQSDTDYPAIENIELYQFDGFVFGSERESGHGHCFTPLQLKAPTWCDRCGEFIWGVYKQCLRCQSKYSPSNNNYNVIVSSLVL